MNAAREAFFRDDLDACSSILNSGKPASREVANEAVLLRARVLLRRFSFTDTVRLLEGRFGRFTSVDESATARMLYGIAVARAGDVRRGLDLLTQLADAARTMEPHRTIRAEIEYWLAFCYWLTRDYAATLQHAVIAEEANADVISVRAATLRGFVAAGRERYRDALMLFRWSREAYFRCSQRDTDLLGRIVLQISMLELALRSAALAGSHDLPAALSRLPQDAGPALGVYQFRIAAYDAWLYALDGDKRRAYDLGRLSESFAPTDGWRLWARANRGLLCAAFVDTDMAYVFARDAVQLVESVDWNATSDEERVGLLLLAEALAYAEPASAAEVLRRYNQLTSSIDRALLFNDDVRLWIVETWVQGLIDREAGRCDAAWQAFKRVYDTAKRLGLLWQAARCLIELNCTPVAGRPLGDDYLQAASLLVHANFPHSFLALRLGRWMNVYRDPVAAKLAPRVLQVLRLYLSAKTSKEVARALGISHHTVKDYTEMLFTAFGVHSKEELLVACYDRGIGSPSWWSVLDETVPLPGGRRLTFNRLEIDEAAHEVRAAGVKVRLKPREFSLLLELASRAGVVLSRNTLLHRVWGEEFHGDQRTVDVHVRRLRAVLEDQAKLGRIIETVHGTGYKFVAESESALYPRAMAEQPHPSTSSAGC
jgi:DNA-binding winged helix-turn-helix (wHTH) protein/DNA-binding CsgD family transcriptional regulator